MNVNLGLIVNIASTLLYGIIFIACIAYLNRVHALKIVHSLAFGLTAAGALGSAMDLWSYAQDTEGAWHFMFRAGVATIAVLHFGLDRRRAADTQAKECPSPHLFERRTTRVL